MSIELRLLFATDDELRLRCRGWKRATPLARPRKEVVIDPFTKARRRVVRTSEAAEPDADATPAPALGDCLLTGRRVGTPFVTEAAIDRLGRALGVRARAVVSPSWIGPGAAIESIAPAFTKLLRTPAGAARAREVAASADVDAALVEELVADAAMAGEVGRELHLHAEVDGVSESWSTLADTFEAHGPRDGRDALALLRDLARDPHRVFHANPRDVLVSRLLSPPLAPFTDRILVLLALGACEHGELAEVVAPLVEAIDATPDAFDDAARAAIVWTFPSMVQVCGKRFGVDAAFRVLASRPAERALVRALYFHEIAAPHRGVDVAELVARVSRLPGDDHRAALEAVVSEGGAGAPAAAERLLLTTNVASSAWVDVVLDRAPPASLLRSLSKLPRDVVRSRIAAALAATNDAGRAQELVVALLHAWFGAPGFTAAPAAGQLAVLVTPDGVPTLRGPRRGNLTGDLVVPWRVAAIVRDPDGSFDDARWAAVQAPRDVRALAGDEREALSTLHANELVWRQPVPTLAAYGLPEHRRDLGDYLGISTPPRRFEVSPPSLGAPVSIHAHDEVDDDGLRVLHAVRDYLDLAFAAPVVVARPAPPRADRPRAQLGGSLTYALLAGRVEGWRGRVTMVVCRSALATIGVERFGSFGNHIGAFSLDAIAEGRGGAELLPRALRVLAQLALLLVGYPFCPSRACLLAPQGLQRPRRPGEEIHVNTTFAPLADVMAVPLLPCDDCLAVAARHAGSDPARHRASIVELLRRWAVDDDAGHRASSAPR